ncbi:hypothetical protein KA037_01925 [Patescibacteria group bacterium]|nr:hypothetical protein [Patescibacteria group bacterium]MBP7841419.1 hypothetical protein [Patescibacteria group bacterium]
MLRQIKNEAMIKAIHQTFFRAKDPRNNATLIRNTTNHMVMCGLFVPFFRKEAELFGIWPMFQTFAPESIHNTQDYISYLKKLSGQYHDNIPLDKESLLNLLLLINQEFIGPNTENTHEELRV